MLTAVDVELEQRQPHPRECSQKGRMHLLSPLCVLRVEDGLDGGGKVLTPRLRVDDYLIVCHK